MWTVNILSLFPEIFPGPLGLSVAGSALKNHLWEINSFNIRDFAEDKHKTVDDYPYGGGSGMVMKVDVLARAIDQIFVPNKLPIYYLSPRGQVFTQNVAKEVIKQPGMNILCGRFEGIDERLFLEYKIHELSLGDFVLSSGDVAAIPIIDACVRLIPGVLEESNALAEESFGNDENYKYLLEYPHYTRPVEWKNHKVPDVLISGHHENINKWRLEQAKAKTKIVRPDLLDRCKNKEKLK